MGDDQKKIAVVVQDRQDEALRMALGLVLADDSVTVINVGDPIVSNEENDMNVESLEMMECDRFSVNAADEDFEQIAMQDVPAKLLEFDAVLPY